MISRGTAISKQIRYVRAVTPELLDMSASSNRLQNSPYFCVFKYARAVKQKVWNEAENRERDWGETLKLRACEARALRARKTLTPRFTDFFTDFEKKPTVLQSTPVNACSTLQACLTT